MFCRSCGAKIPDDSRFCPQCGEKVVTISDSDQSERKSQQSRQNQQSKKSAGKVLTILGKYQVSVSPNLEKYVVVRRVLEQYASIQQKRAYDFAMENVYNFDDVYKIMMPGCLKLMHDYAEFAADLFKRIGLDAVDAAVLIKKSITEESYNAEFPNINLAMDKFEAFMDTPKTKSVIDEAKSELYDELDVEAECAEGIYNICCKIMDTAIDLFIAAGLIPDVQFDSKTARDNYKSIVRAFENSRITESEAIDHLCQCIELEPYHLWFPAYIFKINPQSERDILALCDYFGIKEQIETWIESIKRNPDEIPGF